MIPYPTYKDSGAEWIGDIPKHWDTRRFKFYYDLKSEKANGTDDVNKIALENIESWTGRYLETNTEFEGDGILFEPEDILFGKLRPYLAKVLAPDFNGSAVGDIYVFKSKDEVSSKFSFFRILSEAFIHVVNGSTYGAKMPRANWDFISNLSIAMPPISEQKQIAKYLDKKTGLIDELIEKKRQMIELLKEKRTAAINQAVTKGLDPTVQMKDSGIDWIGDIPKHWKIVNLKNIGRVIGGFAFKSTSFCKQGIKVIKITNIQTMSLDWTKTEYLPDEFYEKHIEYSVTKGSLVFALTRPIISTGLKASIVDIPEDEKVLLNQRTGIFKPAQGEVLTKFTYYLSSSSYFIHSFATKIKTTNQPNISTEDIATIKVTLPCINEQQQIVDYLEHKITQIDTLIAKTEQHIELLQERRTALINDAVTGKIDIREEA